MEDQRGALYPVNRRAKPIVKASGSASVPWRYLPRIDAVFRPARRALFPGRMPELRLRNLYVPKAFIWNFHDAIPRNAMSSCLFDPFRTQIPIHSSPRFGRDPGRRMSAISDRSDSGSGPPECPAIRPATSGGSPGMKMTHAVSPSGHAQGKDRSC